jgi:hypothetical protein
VKPGNREFDRGNCNTDRRSVFNLTALAQTPQFSNNTLRMVATGWHLSGIYRFSTGEPLDVTGGVDRALNGVTVGGANSAGRQRPNQLVANAYQDNSARPYTQWLNPAAFSLPDLGTYGNVGYDAFHGPNAWSFDMSLSRTFDLREAQHLEVRAEAFNVMNSFRPVSPATNISQTNTFGQIRQSLDPRILQFALKYVF